MTYKRFLAAIAAVSLLVTLSACGRKRTLHCDHCGKEVQVDADSNMEEDWIIFCGECEKTLFPDGVVAP